MVLRASLQAGLLNQSSAQVIDGSLKFNGGYLTRTPSSNGNRKTWTFSCWVKFNENEAQSEPLLVAGNSSSDFTQVYTYKSAVSDIALTAKTGSSDKVEISSNNLLRDTGWYHIVAVFDSTGTGYQTDSTIYVNGVEISRNANTFAGGQNYESWVNSTAEPHYLGYLWNGNTFKGHMSQVYLIDGQALGPENFGFTDPLTNTWRPKKFSGSFTQSSVNDGTTWSSSVSGPVNSSKPLSLCFGGTIGSGYQNGTTPTGGNTLTLDISSKNLTVTNVRLNTFISLGPGGTGTPNTFTVNGTTVPISGQQDQTHVVAVNGQLNTIAWSYDDGNGPYVYMRGIEVDLGGGLGYELLTDGVNNTGVNSFYLPMDGNSPIGQDKSGNGNDFTPVNFGGSIALDNSIASGALPILNTTQGGTQAGVGVRTDAHYGNLVLALPLVGNKEDVTHLITGGSAGRTITTNGNAAASNVQRDFYNGSFYFDGNGDYLSVSSTSDFAFGTNDWTVEYYAYPTSTTQYQRHFYLIGSNANQIEGIYANSSGIAFGKTNVFGTTAVNNPLNQWNHYALVHDSTNMRLYINGIQVTTSNDNFADENKSLHIGYSNSTFGGYFTGYMQDFRMYKGLAKYTSNFVVPSTNPDILPDTPSGVSGKSKLTKITDGGVNIVKASTSYLDVSASSDFRLNGEFCIEYFVKLNDFSNDTVYARTFVLDGATGDGGSNNIHLNVNPSTGNVLFWNGSSERIAGTIPISGGWHHVALTRDSSNDIRLFVDGRISGTDSSNTTDFNPNSGSPRPRLGGLITGNNGRVDGTFSNWRIVKGSAIYTSNFTPPTEPLTNVTNTKLLCCQSSTSATEAAVIPTGSITANGAAAATNFNPFTTDINTVRGQETGYATWNPLKMGTSDVSMSEGNLFWRTTSNGPDRCTYSTIGMDSGKFYWENEIVEATATAVGIANILANQDAGPASAHNWMYYSATGQKYIDGSGSSYGAAYNTNGTIIGVAFDRDNLTLEFYKNGVSQGKLTSISGLTDSETYFAMCGDSGGASQSQVRANFGQKPFKFPPPDGFQPLNAANVRPVKVISRSDQYVGVATYSGTTGDGTITSENIKFTPDFVWVKYRDGTEGHALYDSVRGPLYRLRSNTNDQQTTGANELKSFIPGGFTAGNNGHIYYNGYDFASWMWKAGGAKGTFNVDDVGYASASAAGITDGTIALTGCSVGTRQGFSILKYTGSGSNGTLAHGLSQAPDFFFGRDLEDTGGSRDWIIYHKSIGATGRLKFNDANTSTASAFFQDTSPTSSLITVGTSNDINSTNDYILYCWHNVPGLQKFGKYTGNNTSAPNGPFVELGFRPALVAIKRLGTGNWIVYDIERDKINPLNGRLYWNTTSANVDNSGYNIDFLSNGFRITGGTNDNYNAASDYVYAAWAEAPSFNLYGAQSNAR